MCFYKSKKKKQNKCIQTSSNESSMLIRYGHKPFSNLNVRSSLSANSISFSVS
jgi:hypothetical protein